MNQAGDRYQLSEIFRAAWSQALVSLTTVEHEVEKVLSKVTEVAAELSPEELKRVTREWAEQLAAQRSEIEKSVDEAVRGAASLFHLPTRSDLDGLSKRIDELARRIDALKGRKDA